MPIFDLPGQECPAKTVRNLQAFQAADAGMEEVGEESVGGGQGGAEALVVGHSAPLSLSSALEGLPPFNIHAPVDIFDDDEDGEAVQQAAVSLNGQVHGDLPFEMQPDGPQPLVATGHPDGTGSGHVLSEFLAYSDSLEVQYQAIVAREVRAELEEEWGPEEPLAFLPVAGHDPFGDYDSDKDTDDGNGASVEWWWHWKKFRNALDDLNLVGEALALQEGDEESLATQLLAHFRVGQVEPGEFRFLVRRLQGAIITEVERDRLAKRRRGEASSSCYTGPLHDALFVASKAPQKSLALNLDEPAWLPPKGRLGRPHLALAVVDHEKEMERQKRFWTAEVLKILSDAGTPLYIMSQASLGTGRIMRGAIGDTRASTMKKYVKAMRRLLSWLFIALGVLWPVAALQVAEFLHAATDEPCSRSTPQVTIQALSWFEKVGGFMRDQCMACQTFLLRTVDSCLERLAKGLVPLWQAARLPVFVIAALEVYVCNVRMLIVLRFRAWTILVKVWGTLRQDDIQHICPDRFVLSGGALVTLLQQTKTSGPTKRVRELPVAIADNVSVTGLPWLTTGLKIMTDEGNTGRNFLLPAGGDEFGHRPASYSEAAAMSRAVMSSMECPVFKDGAWGPSGALLLRSEYHGFWTEHSPRSVLPSLANELDVGITKDEKDNLGRWSPSGSDNYVRTFKKTVCKIQRMVMDLMKQTGAFSDEDDIRDKLSRYLLERLGVEPLHREAVLQDFSRLQEGFRRELAGQNQHQLHELPELPQDGEAELEEADQLPSVAAEGLARKMPIAVVGRVSKFVLVFSRNRRHARLHKILGGCPWSRLKARDSQELEAPESSDYDSRCKHCWPELRIAKMAKKPEAEDASSSSSSSGTDSD